MSLSQGAALGLKAVRFKRTERSDAHATASLAVSEAVLQRVIAEAAPKFEEDCLAVRAMIALFKAARKSSPPAEPETHAENTLDDAMEVPLAILPLARDGVAAVENVIGIVSRTVICEAGASASLMWAGAQISYWIVCNNAEWLSGRKDWSVVLDKAREARTAARQSHDAVCRVASEIVGGAG